MSYNLSSVLKYIVTVITLVIFIFLLFLFGWGSNEKGWKRVLGPSGLELEEILSNLKFPFLGLNWCWVLKRGVMASLCFPFALSSVYTLEALSCIM